MIAVGIDPGNTGAMALVTAVGELLDTFDITSNDGRIHAAAMVDQFSRWNEAVEVDVAIVENVSAMPSDGGSSGFKFGRAAGYAEMLPACFLVRTEFITPSRWKAHHKITKKGKNGKADKDASRTLAMRRWPDMIEHFQPQRGRTTKAQGQARADAALLAVAWLETNDISSPPPPPLVKKRPRRR